MSTTHRTAYAAYHSGRSITEEQQYNMNFDDEAHSDLDSGGVVMTTRGRHDNTPHHHTTTHHHVMHTPHDIEHAGSDTREYDCDDSSCYDDHPYGYHGNRAGHHDRYVDEDVVDREWMSRHHLDSENDDRDVPRVHSARAHEDTHSSHPSRHAHSARMASAAGSDYTTTAGNDAVQTKTSRHGNVMLETMSAPHPCCPNTKGVCCLMLLLNLSLILVSLGFIIVLQLFRPPFVWYIGIVLLVVGVCALIFCLVYCVWVCGERRHDASGHTSSWHHPQQLYWTHHWRKQWPLTQKPPQASPNSPAARSTAAH